MRARLVRRWTVANLAGVLAASLIFAGPVAAAQVYGITQLSPAPATVDYSDLVQFRGTYTCVNGTEPDPLCPTTTQSGTATFALRPSGGTTFTTVATVSTSLRFTTSSTGCPTTCSVAFFVQWKAGRAPGGISVPAGVYDVRLTTTLTPGAEAVLLAGLTIDVEGTTTTYTGGLAGQAGDPLAVSAAVADEDLGQFAGTSLWLPDLNFGTSSPVSFALYDASNTTLVAGPVTAAVGGGGATVGTPSLTLPNAAGTFMLRTLYPGNAYYGGSQDLDTVTVSGSNAPPSLALPGPLAAEATSAAGAIVSFTASASDAEDDADPTVSCTPASGATFPLGTTTVTCQATDTDGATTSGAFSVTVVDTTDPAVTIWTDETAATSGWFSEATNDAEPGLTVQVAATDLVGVASLACTADGVGVGPLAATGGAFVLGDGSHVVACAAVDGAGNDAGASADFDVDQTAPSAIAFVGGSLVEGGAYDFGFVPEGPTGCTAVDDASGLASCAVTGYDASVGSHAVVATAIDVAGNVGTASLSYTVLPWTLVGFAKPVDMTAPNEVKGGSQVPLKFRVFAGTTELSTLEAVVGLGQVQVGCDTERLVGTPEPADSRSPLRYDAAGGFGWSWLSPRLPGTCWLVWVETLDGSRLSAEFHLR